MALELIPADRFTVQQLTGLYNQTRVDYLVPMPMNADRLAEYISDFDIDLAHSAVARSEEGEYLGLAMLGVRPGYGWVTRLGVLPLTRRHGAGSALMDFLIQAAEDLGLPAIILEVIKDNTPAHSLFLKKGFVETGEYLVMRRAPRPIVTRPFQPPDFLTRPQALELLESYPGHLTWINAVQAMRNAEHVHGLQVDLPDVGKGWLVFRAHKFTISHLVFHTVEGDPAEVGRELLRQLHDHLPRQDTYAENIHADDPHLPALLHMGYFEAFRRVEMIRK